MADRFEGREPDLTGPALHGFAVIPDDEVSLAETTRALYVGIAGDVRVGFASGGEVTLRAVPAGTMLPLRAVRVAATGTTAGDIVGLV